MTGLLLSICSATSASTIFASTLSSTTDADAPDGLSGVTCVCALAIDGCFRRGKRDRQRTTLKTFGDVNKVYFLQAIVDDRVSPAVHTLTLLPHNYLIYQYFANMSIWLIVSKNQSTCPTNNNPLEMSRCHRDPLSIMTSVQPTLSCTRPRQGFSTVRSTVLTL